MTMVGSPLWRLTRPRALAAKGKKRTSEDGKGRSKSKGVHDHKGGKGKDDQTTKCHICGKTGRSAEQVLPAELKGSPAGARKNDNFSKGKTRRGLALHCVHRPQLACSGRDVEAFLCRAWKEAAQGGGQSANGSRRASGCMGLLSCIVQRGLTAAC